MINTVIFDLGNVLAEYDWERYLGQFHYDSATYNAVADAVFLNEDWVRGDSGEISAKDWEKYFVENAPEYEAEIRQVYAGLGECIRRFDYTDDWIEDLRRKGMKIYYLSNYSEGLYEMTKKQLSFIDSFDGGIFSYREKCIKPDPKIYIRLLRQYNIQPEEAVFYDDRPENIETADKLGIHGVLFTRDQVMKDIVL